GGGIFHESSSKNLIIGFWWAAAALNNFLVSVFVISCCLVYTKANLALVFVCLDVKCKYT
ncbi:hypothetical protein SAMN02910263_04527, partial [Butyrivibrio sp. INlla16]